MNHNELRQQITTTSKWTRGERIQYLIYIVVISLPLAGILIGAYVPPVLASIISLAVMVGIGEID